MSHDETPKFVKLFALQRLGHVVCNDVFGGTMLHCQIAFLYLIRDKEIANVKRTSSLARRLLTIGLKQNSTFVVLAQDILVDFITLLLQEQLCPRYFCNKIIHSNKFSFSRTSSVELLFLGSWDLWEITASCHC